MKKFKNVETALENEDDSKTKYSDLIILCLDNMPEKGFSRAVTKERNRVEDAALKEKKGFIEMEDNDVKVMQSVVEDMTWSKRNRELEGFQDFIADDSNYTDVK